MNHNVLEKSSKTWENKYFFRQINAFIEITKELISRKFLSVRLWKSRQKHDHCFYTHGIKNQHFFRQINAFTKEITKELISRKFFSVIVCTFPDHTVLVGFPKC